LSIDVDIATAFLSAQNITINSNGTIVNSGTITSQDDTNITASNITNQNGVMTLLLMVMFCALKNAWGVLLKSSSVAPAK
jgi:hypothetical protein